MAADDEAEPTSVESATTAPVVPALSDEERKARRRRLTLILTPIVAFAVAGTVVNLVSPGLIKHHPLVVIFFNPINRYLLAASNKVGVVPFFAVGFFRLLATDPLYFLLGRWHGEGALDWMERKTGDTGLIPILKKGFAKAGPVIVFLAPNGYVCLLAGASGMSVPLFVGLNVVGTIGRLILIRQVASFLESYINPVIDFIDRYKFWFIGISIALFAVQQITNRKSGKTGELMTVSAMEAEIEASLDAAGTEAVEPTEPL